MRIPREYPVLSLGVSVEKGLEGADIGPTDPKRLLRASWDWERLVKEAGKILNKDVPAVAQALGTPVTLRFESFRSGNVFDDESRVFTFTDDVWFERNRGTASVRKIAEHIADLDKNEDHWVVASFALDQDAATVDKMSAAKVAKKLFEFEPLRRRLRGHGRRAR